MNGCGGKKKGDALSGGKWNQGGDSKTCEQANNTNGGKHQQAVTTALDHGIPRCVSDCCHEHQGVDSAMRHNVELTGAARFYRAATVLTAGLDQARPTNASGRGFARFNLSR